MSERETAGRWRLMRVGDVRQVDALAIRVHPDLPERIELYENRMGLFPEGCLVLERSGEIAGYGLAYPARHRAPPPLDTLLPALPQGVDSLYIHDVAVAPEFRGQGLAEAGIRQLLALAERFPAAMLVSVYGTAPFWGRFGFEPRPEAVSREKLEPYGPTAIFMERTGKGQETETLRCNAEKD